MQLLVIFIYREPFKYGPEAGGGGGGVGGEDLHMKGAGMFVVSISGVNCAFWSHLGCLGKNTIICNPHVAVKVSFRVSCKEIQKYRVVFKSRQPAKFASFSARFRWLLSLLHKLKYVEEMMCIRSHNRLLFHKTPSYLKT